MDMTVGAVRGLDRAVLLLHSVRARYRFAVRDGLEDAGSLLPRRLLGHTEPVFHLDPGAALPISLFRFILSRPRTCSGQVPPSRSLGQIAVSVPLRKTATLDSIEPSNAHRPRSTGGPRLPAATDRLGRSRLETPWPRPSSHRGRYRRSVAGDQHGAHLGAMYPKRFFTSGAGEGSERVGS